MQSTDSAIYTVSHCIIFCFSIVVRHCTLDMVGLLDLKLGMLPARHCRIFASH